MSQTAVSEAGSPGLRLASARGRWVVTTTVLGSGMAALDATVVGIALPAMGRDFHAGVSSLQWVVDAYTLTLAGLLLLGGTLGDSYGRRKMFVVGTVWFAIASLLCGLAPNVAVLIAARALQGVGGALLTPGSLSILQASFAEDDRGAAIGAWSGLGGAWCSSSTSRWRWRSWPSPRGTCPRRSRLGPCRSWTSRVPSASAVRWPGSPTG
jgi:MFS family permease